MTVRSFTCPTIGEFPGRSGHCCYGVFNRHGGVSIEPYGSLNIGHNVGDLPASVDQNRRLVKERLRVPWVLSARQVHGPGIYCLTEPLAEDRSIEGVDALITDLSGIGLMIQQADCQAVLLYDPIREVIAAVHCGWRGSVQGILAEVIAVMVEKYRTEPADLQGIISPSLGPCCAEFVNHKRELPTEFESFMVRDNYFDFWQISKFQLVSAGMVESHIRTVGICTCCSEEYFSYRRATRQRGGPTGRNCSVVALGK